MPLDFKIFKTVMDAALAFIGKKIDLAADRVAAAVQRDDATSVSTAISQQTRTLGALSDKIATALKDLRQIEVQSDVNIDTSALEGTLSDILKVCTALKLPSTTNLEAAVKMTRDAVLDGNAATVAALAALTTAISSLSLKVPSTFELDKNQLRMITGSMRSMPTNPGVLAARNVRTVNVALTASGTEYSYVFPANTTAWNLKLRDQGTLGYYSFVTGKMPSGGDSTNYVTIPQNFVQSPANVDWSGKTIYLGAESNSQVAELTVFTA